MAVCTVESVHPGRTDNICNILIITLNLGCLQIGGLPLSSNLNNSAFTLVSDKSIVLLEFVFSGHEASTSVVACACVTPIQRFYAVFSFQPSTRKSQRKRPLNLKFLFSTS